MVVVNLFVISPDGKKKLIHTLPLNSRDPYVQMLVDHTDIKAISIEYKDGFNYRYEPNG